MSPLEPIALIYEREGLPRFELPPELHRLYGGDFGLPERSVYANFVSTIDGVVAIPALRRSNRLISDDSEPDRFVMGLLRACADAVLVGSGTLRGSPNARWQAQGAFAPAASSLVELRRLLGRAGEPEVAIVTGSGSIDPAHPALREGALVLTTARGATMLEGQVTDASQLVVLPGSDRVDARAVVDFLRSRGHERILSEAGPTLFGSLASAGLVDELFLTVSPPLAGRSTLELNLGLVEARASFPLADSAGSSSPFACTAATSSSATGSSARADEEADRTVVPGALTARSPRLRRSSRGIGLQRRCPIVPMARARRVWAPLHAFLGDGDRRRCRPSGGGSRARLG